MNAQDEQEVENPPITVESYLTGSNAVVDPTLKSHISSLVSALGGPDHGAANGNYVIGDDGLACLKDLKQWLRGYDEKLGRMDVARCLAEADFVRGDLLEIMAIWKWEDGNDKGMFRMALACIELMVPLLWPIDLNARNTSNNQARHAPFMLQFQLASIKALLNHEASLLQRIIRVALPSVALDRSERTERDEGIIRLVLYLIRNVSAVNNDELRSSTIIQFEKQSVFDFIITIASNVERDFQVQDTVILEILYHMTRGVNANHLYQMSADGPLMELQKLVNDEKERGIAKSRNRETQPNSRHSRFGPLNQWPKIAPKGWPRFTLSGQKPLLSDNAALKIIDVSKTWKKRSLVRRRINIDISKPTFLSITAIEILGHFVNSFLDGAFNPLFINVKKAFQRENVRIQEAHKIQFPYLVGFFLEAERKRRTQNTEDGIEPTFDFGLVAGVLDHHSLVLLTKLLRDAYELKQTADVQAGMLCMKQILLTVQHMARSPSEEDQEIAENMQSRVFYEESTLIMLVSIIRTYKDQPLGYLDLCTELGSLLLKMLERFSKSNTHLYIRARRRHKKKSAISEGAKNIDLSGSEGEEDLERRSSERHFEFTRFEREFLNHHCVDTYQKLLENYRELQPEQIKRVISFFHRVFVARKYEVLLFRMDLCHLFDQMINDRDYRIGNKREVQEFVTYFSKRLVKKLHEQPGLFVELLFTKLPATMHYIQYGTEKEVRQPRAPAEMEVKPGLEYDRQVAVAVGCLLEEEKSDFLDWLKGQVNSVISERRAWQNAFASRNLDNSGTDTSIPDNYVLKPDDQKLRISLFKDNKLRLLLNLLHFERDTQGIDNVERHWVIPGGIAISGLEESAKLLREYTDNPPAFDDNKSALELVRRRQRARLPGSESDDDGLEAFLVDDRFKANDREPSHARPSKKRKRPLLANNLSLEEIEDRREKRRKADRERMDAVKSSLYVNASDDESDDERDRIFFAREAALRKENTSANSESNVPGPLQLTRKRKGEELHETPRTFDADITNDKESTRQQSMLSSPFSGQEPTSPAERTDTEATSSQSVPASFVMQGSETVTAMPSFDSDEDETLVLAEDGRIIELSEDDDPVLLRTAQRQSTKQPLFFESDTE